MLDANILIRAVLGNRVRRILEAHAANFPSSFQNLQTQQAEEQTVPNFTQNPTRCTSFLSFRLRHWMILGQQPKANTIG